MKQKILFIIPCNASLGHLLPETFRPYFIFIKNKYVIDFAISKEQSTARSTKNDDFLDLNFLRCFEQKKSFSLEDVDLQNYRAIYIPGGFVQMANNKRLQDFLLKTYEKKS